MTADGDPRPHASPGAGCHTTRHDHTAGIIRSWQPFASWSPCQGTLSRLDTASRTRIITRRMMPDPKGPTLHTGLSQIPPMFAMFGPSPCAPASPRLICDPKACVRDVRQGRGGAPLERGSLTVHGGGRGMEPRIWVPWVVLCTSSAPPSTSRRSRRPWIPGTVISILALTGWRSRIAARPTSSSGRGYRPRAKARDLPRASSRSLGTVRPSPGMGQGWPLAPAGLALLPAAAPPAGRVPLPARASPRMLHGHSTMTVANRTVSARCPRRRSPPPASPRCSRFLRRGSTPICLVGMGRSRGSSRFGAVTAGDGYRSAGLILRRPADFRQASGPVSLSSAKTGSWGRRCAATKKDRTVSASTWTSAAVIGEISSYSI